MKKHWQIKLYSALTALLTIIATSGCGSSSSTANIPAITDFNAARYMGKWYEIARLPHSFEQNITDAQADYTLEPNGNIAIVNSGLRQGVPVAAYGIGKVSNVSGFGEIKVSFFGPFYGIYKIIYLNKDYTLAIVSGSTMDYVWILARKPVISRAELAVCLEMLKKWGFAVNLLQYPTGMISNLVLPAK